MSQPTSIPYANTVGELIQLLQTLDPNLLVIGPECEVGVSACPQSGTPRVLIHGRRRGRVDSL